MYEFDRATPVTVVLRANSGEVTVTAEERSTVEVDVQPMDDKGREAAEKTRVVLEDDTLLVQAPGTDQWRWRRSPRLRMTVRVPAGSSLAGRSAAADVRALGVFAEVRLDVASADVAVAEVTGNADLEAASGNLAVERVGGSLRAETSSGKLRIGDVTGDVSLESASGDIRFGSAGGSVTAKSASGDIEIGSLRQGKSRVRTASGDVRVGVAAGTGVWLDLNTASGKSISDLTRRDGEGEASGATLELEVRTASGNITVHRASVGGASSSPVERAA